MAVPPAESAIGEAMERFTPEGIVPIQTGVKTTELVLNPFKEVRVIGIDTSCPCCTATVGVAESAKSAVAEDVVVTDPVTIVNVADPESPVGVPVAVTKYEPKVKLTTSKEPVRAPFETEHEEAVTTKPESVQLESLAEKPVPVT